MSSYIFCYLSNGWDLVDLQITTSTLLIGGVFLFLSCVAVLAFFTQRRLRRQNRILAASHGSRAPCVPESSSLGRPREWSPSSVLSSSDWCQIPESIMSEILRRINQEDKRSLRMVCRDWYMTTTHSLDSLKPSEFHSKNLTRDFPLLRILDLSQCVEDVSPNGLQAIQELRHLTELTLGRNHNLIATTITDQSLVSIKLMTKIRVLNLAQCVHISNQGLHEISMSLVQLEQLNISGCVGVTDHGVQELASISTLHTLEMPWCLKISDQGIAALNALPKLKHLNISGCQLITEHGIAQIGQLINLEVLNLLYTKLCVSDESLEQLHGLVKLKSLSLGGMQLQHTQISDRGMKTIARSFPLLSSLSLTLIDLTDEGVSSFISLSNLESLSIKGCARVTQGSLKSISKLSKLKELSLLYNPWLNLTDEVLEELSPLTGVEILSLGDTHSGNLLTDDGMAILSTFQNLQNLNLSYFQWQFAGSGLGPLTKLQNLENVDFTGSNNVNDSTLSVLGTISSIRSLQLSKCSRISSAGLKHLMKLSKLGFLSLAGCFRVDDHGLEFLSEIPSLTSLILSQCIGITDGGLHHLRKLQKLKILDLFGCREIRGNGFDGYRDLPLCSLNISDCPYLVDEGMIQIGKIRSLTKLDMCACISVTDTGISALSELPNLTGLDVGMCGRLSDVSMLSLSKLPRLTTFKLSGSDLVTDLGVAHIAKKTGLLTVHLDRCHNVSDSGLQQLATCRSLTSLRLARCPKITDNGIMHLTALDQLSILNLTQCPFVTENGLQILTTSLTSLASLEV
eukprot:g6125.t1